MALRISELTDPQAVTGAVRMFDRLGRDQFLARYGYSRARSYFLEVGGRRYDSKAIAGVAYGLQHPEQPTPTPSDFSGGDSTVAQTLRRLGFRVVEAGPGPARQVSRDAIDTALDEWDEIGRDEFLRRHDVVPAQRYVIERDGRRYDAKAIVTVAYRRDHPDEPPLLAGDFTGDRRTIRLPLEELGFRVVDLRAGIGEEAWDLAPGEQIRRVDLHDRVGGGRQGGIAASATTPNVLVFSDPSSGEQHGYFDRWNGDELHYAGEGQRGDQVLARGNRAILEHRAQGKALRVFWGSKGVVEYAGEFAISETDPYFWVTAPETGGGPPRQVVMFRLRPLGTPTVVDPARPARRIIEPRLTTSYRPVDPTKGAAPRDPFTVDPNVVDRGLKGHAATQEALAELVRTHGLEPLSPGPGDPNFDLAWRDDIHVTVVEVKSLTNTNEAGQIRLGLGQVLDYQALLERSGDPVRPVLAVERQPIDHRWWQLCDRHGVALTWPATFEQLFRQADGVVS